MDYSSFLRLVSEKVRTQSPIGGRFNHTSPTRRSNEGDIGLGNEVRVSCKSLLASFLRSVQSQRLKGQERDKVQTEKRQMGPSRLLRGCMYSW
jgi:hypothetical protein